MQPGHVNRRLDGMNRPQATWLPRAAAVLFGLFSAGAVPAAPDAVEQLLLHRTNEVRRAEGLSPLRFHPRLQAAAESFAAYMARTERFDHEADGRTPQQRSEAAGYTLCMVAENIAWEFNSRGFSASELSRRFVQGWMESPPHRANLLDPTPRDTGIAVARSASSGRHYAVQLFARAPADGVEFKVSNPSRRATAYRLDGHRQALPPHTTMTHVECVPPRLVLAGEDATRVPSHGDRFVLRTDGAGWRVEQGDGAHARARR